MASKMFIEYHSPIPSKAPISKSPTDMAVLDSRQAATFSPTDMKAYELNMNMYGAMDRNHTMPAAAVAVFAVGRKI